MEADNDSRTLREHPLGWLRVWGFALAGLAVPTWGLATAVYIQLSPALNGADAGLTAGDVPWSAWVRAGWDVGCAMGWLVPLGLLLVVVIRIGQTIGSRNTLAERQRRALEIEPDAVIDDADWDPSA